MVYIRVFTYLVLWEIQYQQYLGELVLLYLLSISSYLGR